MRGSFALLLLVATPLAAQDVAEQARALIAAKRAASAATARSTALEREAGEARGDAARARVRAAAVAARIRAAEADIAAAEARVRIVGARRALQRRRLARGQAPLVRMAAALQTLARRPAGFALVQPGSIDDIVHVRALLAASGPVIATRTATLRNEVAEAERLTRQAAAAAATLRTGQARLREERRALQGLASAQRAHAVDLAAGAMDEGDRALALGEKARDIADLMQEMGVQAEVRARLRTLPGPMLRPELPGQIPTPATPARLPAVLANYRLPVSGRIVTGMGETAASGVRAKGITVATAPRAFAVAPAAGRVAFAGALRGWGHIVILDHGDGWTSLVAGLSGTTPRVGAMLAAGAPLGRAPREDARVTMELRHHGIPADLLRMAGS